VVLLQSLQTLPHPQQWQYLEMYFQVKLMLLFIFCHRVLLLPLNFNHHHRLQLPVKLIVLLFL